jgi:hypothetical protein
MKTVLIFFFGTMAFVFSAEPDTRFRHFDKNSNGKLSAEEFPYPVIFKQLDLDGDGVLSLKKAEAIPTRGKAPAASPTNPPTPHGIPAPDFSPYHRVVFDFLAQRDRYQPKP